MFQLLSLLSRFLRLYEMLIFVWALLSWFPTDYDSPVARFREILDGLVAPYVDIFRSLIPPIGGIDFSPIVAIFVLEMVERILYNLFLGGLVVI